MLKGDTVRLQSWLIIGRVSWLDIVAYTNACHKAYKGDWLHSGLLQSFWKWEILAWNFMFVSLGGQFSQRHLIPMATRHVVLREKTLESPLDCKEIRPVHPKGNQTWLSIGRTDAEAKTPILWPPDEKSCHLQRPWCWERLRAGGDDRGWDGWMASHTQWTWVWTHLG